MALVVLAVGLLAVASLGVATAGETRRAAWRGAQTLAADRLLGDALRRGFEGAVPGPERLSVRTAGREVEAVRRTEPAGPRVLRIRVVAAGARGVPADAFEARLHRRAELPRWAWEIEE